MIENYKAQLKVLTPIIINTGDSFDFGEIYPIESKVTKYPVEFYKGYQINTQKIFVGISSAKKKFFTDQIANASFQRDNEKLRAVRKELIDDSTKEKVRIPCRFLPKAAYDLSQKPLQKVDKVMQMESTSYTYIPGSSVKGALRTAVLEGLRQKCNLINYPREKNKDFEIRVASRGKEDYFKVCNDMFRYLKVSDFSFSGIDGIQYIGKIGDDEEMPIYSSMTNAFILKGEPVVATGTISIDSRFYDLLGLNLSNILRFISDFFFSPFESKKVEDKMKRKVMQPIVDYMNKDESNDVYFRLGHYIGIQNYTFNVEQPITKRNHNPRINMEGGSRVICIESGIVPGICMLNLKREK